MKSSVPHAPGRRLLLLAAATALTLTAGAASASQLVYTPIDPSFGGNPLNGTFLMGIANQEAQENAPNPLDGLTGLNLTSLGTSIDTLNKAVNQLNNNVCSSAGSNCTPSNSTSGNDTGIQ